MTKMVVLIVWAILLGGLYPLARLWQYPSSLLGRLSLGAMSISYLWCLAGVAFPSAIGPHYSNIRVGIIQVNLWGSLALCVTTIKFHDRKLLALLVGIWLVGIWLYVRTISFVV